ncbi:MAG: glycosyltransferase [bacterium]
MAARSEARKNFVILARDAWGEVWRRRHFLAAELSKEHRVLFVEVPFPLMRGAAGAGGGRRSLRGVFSAALRPAAVGGDLFVASPVKVFSDALPGGRAVNLALHARVIANALRRLRMKDFILWSNPEYGVDLIPLLRPALTVYDVTDDWTEAPLPARERKRIAADDARMLRAADLVFTVSHDLFEKKRLRNRNTFLVPNGAPVEWYRDDLRTPEDIRDLPRPVLGYAGTLHPQRIDVDLAAALAERVGGNGSVVFVGPDLMETAAWQRLKRRANVRVLGARRHDRVPAYVSSFDVCLIPHLVNRFTGSLNPIKVYEYLAAGKPIVSTLIEGAEEFSRFIVTARGERFIEEAVRAAAAGVGDAALRRAAAAENSWRRRAESALRIIERTLGTHGKRAAG